MLSIRQAIRILRAVAEAIRQRDFPTLVAAIEEIANAIGLDAELAELKATYEALRSGDYGKMFEALSNLIDMVSAHLNHPRLIASAVGTDAEPGWAAARLDAEADHWVKHVGHRGNIRGEIEDTPQTAAGINVGVIMLIFEAILAAVKWWRDREQFDKNQAAREPDTGDVSER